MIDAESRLPCTRCGTPVLPATLARNEGYCAPCARRRDSEALLARHGEPVPLFRVRLLVEGTSPRAFDCVVRAQTPTVASRDAEAMLVRWLEREAGGPAPDIESGGVVRVADDTESTAFAALDLVARPAVPADHPVAPPPLDLQAIEDTLATAAIVALDDFFRDRECAGLDGFAFDCNALYGEVLLSLDERGARATDKEAAMADFGGWTHLGFNLEQAEWLAAWGAVERKIADWFERTDDRDACAAMVEALLQAFCRAFVRVERSGALAGGRLASNAWLRVMDHDDAEDRAMRRLDAARRNQAPSV